MRADQFLALTNTAFDSLCFMQYSIASGPAIPKPSATPPNPSISAITIESTLQQYVDPI